MNFAQYLNLPTSYCTHVDLNPIIFEIDNNRLIRYFKNQDILYPPASIINYLVEKAKRNFLCNTTYTIYVVAIFHLLATPIFQRQLMNKHELFSNIVVEKLSLFKQSYQSESYIKKTFVAHKLILKSKFKKKLFILLYVRSVFINLYFSCLQNRYKFGSIGYFESKKRFENRLIYKVN
jgi:hypothetical protein